MSNLEGKNLWVGVLLCLILLILGLYGISGGMHRSNWVQTEGAVIDSKWQPKWRWGDYRGSIRYQYEAGNARYQGNYLLTTGVLDEFSWRTTQELQAEYRPGASLKVWYDPEQPGESSLRKTTHPFAWICLILGVFGLIAFIRRLSKERFY